MLYSKDAWSGVYKRTLKDGIIEAVCDMLKLLPRGVRHNSTPNKLRRLIYKLCGVQIGCRSYIYQNVTLVCPQNIRLGVDSFINCGCLLSAYADIIIGNRVSIGYNCCLITETHNPNSPDFEAVIKPIVIEDNVWLGANATILPGAVIGEGAIIAAGAVVAEDTRIERYSVYAGVPARKIKERAVTK